MRIIIVEHYVIVIMKIKIVEYSTDNKIKIDILKTENILTADLVGRMDPIIRVISGK